MNGLQVSPAELEKGLMAHQAVVDAAVVSYQKCVDMTISHSHDYDPPY